MEKTKKKHFTFRMDESLHDTLDEEAAKQGLTPTTLMSQITKNYLLRDKFLLELGFVPFGKEFIKILLEQIDENQIKKITQTLGENHLNEFVVYFYQKIDVNGLVCFLDLWLSTQGEFQKQEKEGKYSYVIHHKINLKYSIFLEGLLLSAIEKILDTKTRVIKKTSNQFSFEFTIK